MSRRSNTVLQYRQIAAQHILPNIGNMRLQDIQPAHLKQLTMMKKEEGRGARTVQLIHTVMHSMQLLKQAGLPSIRFHDLRHTSISFLLDIGTPVNTVQRRAGHSKARVTTDTYGHSLAHAEAEAAARIEEFVTPVAVKLLSK
ncbi:MAG: tyrosine-type recombinase/integrase [Anaerolineales bacterium]